MENDFKLVEAYWREWEHRHSLFWSLYLKSVFAVSLLLAIPFIGKHYLKGKFVVAGFSMPAENMMILVPVISMLVVFFSYVLLSQEYARIQVTGYGYQDAFDTVSKKLRRFRRYGPDGPALPTSTSKSVRKFGVKFSSHILTLMNISLALAVVISAVEVFILLGLE